MALSRSARPGCNSGAARNCAVMSGEALTSAQQSLPLPRTAIEDWVRGRARSVPARTPAQFRQLQFHCGKPPPAAAPSTRIFTRVQEGWRSPPVRAVARSIDYRLAMYIVISMPYRMSIACGISHFMMMSLLSIARPAHDLRPQGRSIGDHHERDLMIFMSRSKAGSARTGPKPARDGRANEGRGQSQRRTGAKPTRDGSAGEGRQGAASCPTAPQGGQRAVHCRSR